MALSKTNADVLNAKILIVDDLEVNVRLLERILSEAGYGSVTSTRNPVEVGELHRKNVYDLILLDLRMPVMDGFQVMVELESIELQSYLPVLVITAEPEEKVRALQGGARDFISKPYVNGEVLARVRNMLEVRLLHASDRRQREALEARVAEVKASHAEISRQRDEVERLYGELVAEHKRSVELSAMPGVMVGVEKGERLSTPWRQSLKRRNPWLLFNLFASLFGGTMVLVFHDTINRLLILAVFVPILISQTSNTGGQTLAIALRGISLGDLKVGQEKALVMKEALLGLLNGLIVGVAAAGAMYVASTLQHQPKARVLSAVVLLAMAGSSCMAGIFGVVVPLTLRKYGADPATASTILLTTVTNVAALLLLFGLATLMIL